MAVMTYAQAIDNAIAFLINEDGSFKDANTIERLEALKAQLAKRKSGKTKGQKENDVLKAEILAFVGEAGAVRAGDVATQFGISGQKASALLNQLVKAETLEKFAEKKVTFFKVAEV